MEETRSTEETCTIHFELLGSFSCRESRDGEKKNTAAGRKVMSFLQYLIVNHARDLSSEELIRQFWGEESSDPANALKNMIYKVRSLLKGMLPDKENLLVTLPGCYAWNPACRLELDSEAFEQACLEVRKYAGDAYLEMLMKATSLYKGDFLQGNDDEWALSLRRYYQTLYLDLCKMALPLLQKEERWTEMIGLCEQAQGVDFGLDTFIVYQMQALISMGHPERAVQVYQSFREQLWQEFEIEPTEQVEQIHMLAESMCRSNVDGQDILKLVAEGGAGCGGESLPLHLQRVPEHRGPGEAPYGPLRGDVQHRHRQPGQPGDAHHGCQAAGARPDGGPADGGPGGPAGRGILHPDAHRGLGEERLDRHGPAEPHLP